MRILGSCVLLLGALLLWAFIDPESTPVDQGLRFVLVVACLLVALRPHYGLSLICAGIMALAFDRGRLGAPGAWNITFLVLSAAGLAYLFRRRRLLPWIGASLPCWAMAQAVPFLMYAAMGLVLAGLALTSVRPLLSRTRQTGIPPLPYLARGPLIEVHRQSFVSAHGSTFLKCATVLCGMAVLAGCILWLGGYLVGGPVLALSAGLIGMTFGFSLWFARRMSFRVDADGIHARVLFGEKSIAWSEIGSLSLRRVYFPGFGMNYDYYCVLSPSMEITFPNTMPGAEELRTLIARATGLTWPGPT